MSSRNLRVPAKIEVVLLLLGMQRKKEEKRKKSFRG